MSELDRVTTLYGSGDSSAPGESKTADTGETSSTDDRINSLYSKAEEPVSGNPYKIETNDTESKINDLYGQQDTVRLPDDLDLSGVTANTEEAENLQRNLGWMASESGASARDVSELVQAANDWQASGASHLSQAERHQTTTEILADFGSNGRQVLADACDLVQSYPELYDHLHRTGLGDNPKVVRKMMHLASTPKGQARIKAFRNRGY